MKIQEFLTVSTTLKNTLLTLALTLLMTATAFANEPGGCPPIGTGGFSPLWGYDYIANGLPYDSGCWAAWAASYTTGYDACGNYRAFWEFGYAGSLTQTLVIPADDHRTTLKFQYRLDFDDPNHDGAWDRFTSQVTDLTTGRILGGEFRSGVSPALFCSTRQFTLSPGYDFAGHTLQIGFNGSKGYSNTHIRLWGVQLMR